MMMLSKLFMTIRCSDRIGPAIVPECALQGAPEQPDTVGTPIGVLAPDVGRTFPVAGRPSCLK